MMLPLTSCNEWLDLLPNDEQVTDDYWKSKEDVIKNWAIDRTFTPEMGDIERDQRLTGWHRAVKCAFGWAREDL